MNSNSPRVDVKTLTFSNYGVNTYVVGDDKQVMIVDMPATTETDFGKLDGAIAGRELTRIVYTHGHFDHIQGTDIARKHYNGVSQYVHEKDAIMFTDANENLTGYFGIPVTHQAADCMLQDGDVFNVGSIEFKVIHTPGHCPGAVCYYTDGFIFTGDTLFCRGVGRTDFPHGDYNLLVSSVEKLFKLPDETLFFPGHDMYSVPLGPRKASFM